MSNKETSIALAQALGALDAAHNLVAEARKQILAVLKRASYEANLSLNFDLPENPEDDENVEPHR